MNEALRPRTDLYCPGCRARQPFESFELAGVEELCMLCAACRAKLSQRGTAPLRPIVNIRLRLRPLEEK